MNAEKENTITMKFERLTKQNFNENSLDTFVRHQDVTECWRNVEGEWKLLPIKFVEEWDVEECRKQRRKYAKNWIRKLLAMLHLRMILWRDT